MNQAVTTTRSLAGRVDRVWLLIAAIPLGLLALAPEQFAPTVIFASSAFLKTAAFIAIAVLLAAALHASSLERIISRAFSRQKALAILLASLAGGLSPFCSCEVIPFVVALLAAGSPLSPVMAFWLSSPLIDPPMFIITSNVLGVDFAIGKTIAAVGVGLLGGFSIAALERAGAFATTLRPDTPMASCCGGPAAPEHTELLFWRDQLRMQLFRANLVENALFLSKWLLLAYILQSLMVAWVPPEWVSTLLGNGGPASVGLGALLGVPAYLNGYAAVPLVDGLVDQGMSSATAMSFLIAGGITSFPAAMAVWAVARIPVFASYIVLACVGAVLSGLAWGMVG